MRGGLRRAAERVRARVDCRSSLVGATVLVPFAIAHCCGVWRAGRGTQRAGRTLAGLAAGDDRQSVLAGAVSHVAAELRSVFERDPALTTRRDTRRRVGDSRHRWLVAWGRGAILFSAWARCADPPARTALAAVSDTCGSAVRLPRSGCRRGLVSGRS